jgi:hypothetical protein
MNEENTTVVPQQDGTQLILTRAKQSSEADAEGQGAESPKE